MKGSVFCGFEQYIDDQYGLHVWQYLIENSDLKSQGIYLAIETYDDQELFQLIECLSKFLAIEASDIQKDFGRVFFKTLFSLIQQHVLAIDCLFDFLRAVDDVIHVEVKKSDPSAYTPSFFYDHPEENKLVMRYLSKRGMCYFAEGLIAGAAEHFKTQATIFQSKCVHCGDDYCLINITI